VRAHVSSNRKLMYALLVLVALLLLWYLFRPERLWINKTVHEPPPHSVLTPAPSMIVRFTRKDVPIRQWRSWRLGG
jgi:hypothetical protein